MSASPPIIDVSVEYPHWNSVDFNPDEIAREIIPLTIRQAEIPYTAENHPIEVSLLLTGDEHIQTLNREYRGMNKPTNVLSFAALDEEDFTPPPGAIVHIGDIVIAFDTLQREATGMNIPLRHHFIHLLIHGTLHLLGYDHMEDKEAEAMESIEIQILSSLGIENPYHNEQFML